MSTITLLAGDVVEVLKTLPDKSVHACICSPPFYGLRDYGTASWEGGRPDCQHTIRQKDRDNKAASKVSGRVSRGKRDVCLHCGAIRIDQQIGLEESPELYVARLVEVFREVRRVLRDDGTLWLNLGDSYWAGKGKNGSSKARATAKERGYQQSRGTVQVETKVTDGRHAVFKPKDLMLIPARVAIALVEDGWYLRQDIIWYAPNKKPESVRDRPTLSHEHIFLFAKQRYYYYDNEAVKVEGAGTLPWGNKRNFKMNDNGAQGQHGKSSMFSGGTREEYINKWYSGKVQRRSVWTVPTKPYKGAHHAPWPEALVEPMLLASTSAKGCCPACGAPWRRITEKENPPHDGETDSTYAKGTAAGERGEEYVDRTITVGWGTSCKCGGDLEPVPCTVIDIFVGSGTTGAVAIKHGRSFIGIDLNPEYIELSRKGLEQVQPLLLLEEK